MGVHNPRPESAPCCSSAQKSLPHLSLGKGPGDRHRHLFCPQTRHQFRRTKSGRGQGSASLPPPPPPTELHGPPWRLGPPPPRRPDGLVACAPPGAHKRRDSLCQCTVLRIDDTSPPSSLCTATNGTLPPRHTGAPVAIPIQHIPMKNLPTLLKVLGIQGKATADLEIVDRRTLSH